MWAPHVPGDGFLLAAVFFKMFLSSALTLFPEGHLTSSQQFLSLFIALVEFLVTYFHVNRLLLLSSLNVMLNFPCQFLHLLWTRSSWLLLFPSSARVGSLLRAPQRGLPLPLLPVVSVFVDVVFLVGVQTLDGRSLVCFTHCPGYESGAARGLLATCWVPSCVAWHLAPGAVIADAQVSLAASFFS